MYVCVDEFKFHASKVLIVVQLIRKGSDLSMNKIQRTVTERVKQG